MLKATAPPARMAAAIPAKIQRWCLLDVGSGRPVGPAVGWPPRPGQRSALERASLGRQRPRGPIGLPGNGGEARPRSTGRTEAQVRPRVRGGLGSRPPDPPQSRPDPGSAARVGSTGFPPAHSFCRLSVSGPRLALNNSVKFLHRLPSLARRRARCGCAACGFVFRAPGGGPPGRNGRL